MTKYLLLGLMILSPPTHAANSAQIAITKVPVEGDLRSVLDGVLKDKRGRVVERTLTDAEIKLLRDTVDRLFRDRSDVERDQILEHWQNLVRNRQTPKPEVIERTVQRLAEVTASAILTAGRTNQPDLARRKLLVAAAAMAWANWFITAAPGDETRMRTPRRLYVVGLPAAALVLAAGSGDIHVSEMNTIAMVAAGAIGSTFLGNLEARFEQSIIRFLPITERARRLERRRVVPALSDAYWLAVEDRLSRDPDWREFKRQYGRSHGTGNGVTAIGEDVRERMTQLAYPTALGDVCQLLLAPSDNLESPFR